MVCPIVTTLIHNRSRSKSCVVYCCKIRSFNETCGPTNGFIPLQRLGFEGFRVYQCKVFPFCQRTERGAGVPAILIRLRNRNFNTQAFDVLTRIDDILENTRENLRKIVTVKLVKRRLTVVVGAYAAA